MKVNQIFGENTPEQIQYAVRIGLAPELWNAGDIIQVPLKGKVGNLELNTSCAATIIGFNHNATIEGTNTLHLCLEPLCDKSYLSYSRNSDNFSHYNIPTNRGGWNYSNIHRNILSQFKKALPESWQNIITPCIKYTDNIGFEVNLPECVTTTLDDMWLLSEYEVFGEITFSNAAEAQYQQQYEYFKEKENRKFRNCAGTPIDWWLRSPRISSSRSFCIVYTDGSAFSHSASYSIGIAPCIQIS